MSGTRAAERGAPERGAPVRPSVRTAETLLWALVVLLFVVRIAPQLRAAANGSGGGRGPVTFAMLDGSSLPLADLEGRVVLVNFWASWCPPCRAEMPGFQRVYESRRGTGFTVVGVSMDERPREEVAAFLRERAIGYPIAMATQPVAAAFGDITTFPTSFLLDRHGRVRYTVQGIFDEARLRAAIDSLLAE